MARRESLVTVIRALMREEVRQAMAGRRPALAEQSSRRRLGRRGGGRRGEGQVLALCGAGVMGSRAGHPHASPWARDGTQSERKYNAQLTRVLGGQA
jgi:hypothetical protein